MLNKDDIPARVKTYEKYIIEKRREIHAHPELSGKEEKTAQLIQNELNRLGIPFVTISDYSVVARIECGNGKKKAGKIV